MSKEKNCESCGMPIRKKEEFGGGNPDNKYCAYCCDNTGKLKSYEDVSEGMKFFMIKNMGMSDQEAIVAVKENMKKMPAWADRS
jgi:hypothetical protein